MSVPSPDRLLLDRMPTPIGTMLLVTDGEGYLRALDWDDYEDRLHKLMHRYYGASAALRQCSICLRSASGRSTMTSLRPR